LNRTPARRNEFERGVFYRPAAEVILMANRPPLVTRFALAGEPAEVPLGAGISSFDDWLNSAEFGSVMKLSEFLPEVNDR
jgi:hypothetical protein